MATLKGILFDLDDTLLDWSGFSGDWIESETLHLRGVYDYVIEQGYALKTFNEFRDEYIQRTRNAWATARSTLRAPHIGEILLQTAVAQGAPEGVLDRTACQRVYRWDAAPGVSVFPDVRPFLDRIRQQGIKVGIVTNAYQPMTMRDAELHTLGLLSYFPYCRFSAADVGYLKPHVQIFQAALKCMGTEPEETLFIGDNPVADIGGAQSAGMQAVLRVRRAPSPMLSGLVVPDATIHSFNELPGVLADLYPSQQQGSGR